MKKYLGALGVAALLSFNSHAAIVTFSGDGVTNGLVGHGETSENPIFDQHGTSIVHPFSGALAGVYTEISSTDAFDFTTGDDTGHAGSSNNFAAVTAPGHGFSSLGVTADDSNPVWVSLSGFVMNTGAASDYYFDTGANVEHRTYRGGTIMFYEQTGVGVFSEIFAFQNVVLGIDIDWTATLANAPDQILSTIDSATPWSGPSGTLPLVDIAMQGSYGEDPVKASGSTTEGRYGIWEVTGNTWTFETVTTGGEVPVPSTLLLALLGLISLSLKRSAK